MHFTTICVIFLYKIAKHPMNLAVQISYTNKWSLMRGVVFDEGFHTKGITVCNFFLSTIWSST